MFATIPAPFRATVLAGLSLGMAPSGLRAQAANPPCPDVPGQFAALKHHPEPLAFDIAEQGVNLSISSANDHWQGIARSNRPGVPYLFVSNSDFDGGIRDNGNVFVVRMDSREADGERMRSNRVAANIGINDTIPPAGDKAVRTIKFGEGPYPAFQHVSGMQIIGDVLAVAVEKANSNNYPGYGSGIVLIDVADPEDPQFLSFHGLPGESAGWVAVAPWSDGNETTYLFLVGGPDSNRQMDLYQTSSGNLKDPALVLEPRSFWSEREPGDAQDLLYDSDGNGSLDATVDWKTDTNALQGATFVIEEGTGRFFVLGGYGTGPFGAVNDYLRLFEVTFSGEDLKMTLKFTKGYDRRVYSDGASDDWFGFKYSFGAYVSPTGNLLAYATHQGTDEGDPKLQKFAEFAHYDGNRQRDAGCNGWVELYDNQSGWEDAHQGRSIIWDYRDRLEEDFGELDHVKPGGNNEASSLRWCLPPGRSVELYRDGNFGGGAPLVLTGSGAYEDLDDIPGIAADWGDDIDSLRVVGDGPHEAHVLPYPVLFPFPNPIGNGTWRYPFHAVHFGVEAISAGECAAFPRLILHEGVHRGDAGPLTLSGPLQLTARPGEPATIHPSP